MAKGINGAQQAVISAAAFDAWCKGKTYDDYKEYVRADKLNRSEIARECGFTTAAFRQNPNIKSALEALENSLREHGVLPATSDTPKIKKPAQRDSGALQRRSDTQRLNRIEQQNAALRAELDAMKAKLEQYNLMDEMLAETGRLPR
ncbi:VPA1267 family protein [Halomonas sp. KRD171]|uniref:VPA1267 family protein n=1 Tax=Halomonas sp. KRD171 TaxID=2729726 RepID=UPI0019D29034|nr:VPA1267 family protein [Halomonas sp. KRD171]